jgi:hypothetical protein
MHEFKRVHERQFTSVTFMSGASLNEQLSFRYDMISVSRLPGNGLFFSSLPVTVAHCMMR